jgi:hypothetical protein
MGGAHRHDRRRSQPAGRGASGRTQLTGARIRIRRACGFLRRARAEHRGFVRGLRRPARPGRLHRRGQGRRGQVRGFGELPAWEDEACAGWPRGADQDRYSGPWNRWTASPILVIGNTGDPATAYHNSVAMARDLRPARLLTVDGFGHTEFFNPSTCASNFEFRYLLTGALPPGGTVCRQTVQPFPRQ